MKRSLEAGEIVPVEADAPPTMCDALQTPRVSPITFAILRDRAAGALFVTDDEVKEAIRYAWREHGLVVEAGGAVALAALLTGKVEPVESTVVVLSGGNIDAELHAQILAEGRSAPRPSRALRRGIAATADASAASS
jgi:threonine dehydratase